jgi:hypothetical protein
MPLVADRTATRRGETFVVIDYEVDDGEVYATDLYVQGIKVTDLFDEIPTWAHDAAEKDYEAGIQQWNLDLTLERKAT